MPVTANRCRRYSRLRYEWRTQMYTHHRRERVFLEREDQMESYLIRRLIGATANRENYAYMVRRMRLYRKSQVAR